jgi:hypothetical protein
MPIELWRSSIPEIYKLSKELASGKGFVKAANAGKKRIHEKYGKKTKEVVYGKNEKNAKIFA